MRQERRLADRAAIPGRLHDQPRRPGLRPPDRGHGEPALGERWGDLTFAEALAFLDQPDADTLEFVAMALDAEDEADLGRCVDIIAAAQRPRHQGHPVAEDVSPTVAPPAPARGRATSSCPTPCPRASSLRAINRPQGPAPAPSVAAATPGGILGRTGDRSGVVIPVYGMAGGAGATTLAVNLAWELAIIDKDAGARASA